MSPELICAIYIDIVSYFHVEILEEQSQWLATTVTPAASSVVVDSLNDDSLDAHIPSAASHSEQKDHQSEAVIPYVPLVSRV